MISGDFEGLIFRAAAVGEMYNIKMRKKASYVLKVAMAKTFQSIPGLLVVILLGTSSQN